MEEWLQSDRRDEGSVHPKQDVKTIFEQFLIDVSRPEMEVSQSVTHFGGRKFSNVFQGRRGWQEQERKGKTLNLYEWSWWMLEGEKWEKKLWFLWREYDSIIAIKSARLLY